MKELDGWAKNPLCPFCNAEWTNEMVDIYVTASAGYESMGPDASGSIKITCGGCKRLVYQKDIGYY